MNRGQYPMNQEQINLLQQIKEAQTYIDKLDELMISIEVDFKYLEQDITIDDLKDCLLNAINYDRWDFKNEHDISFIKEPEKRNIFFNGIKMGYLECLFAIADDFGLIDFFEKNIEPKFRDIKDE